MGRYELKVAASAALMHCSRAHKLAAPRGLLSITTYVMRVAKLEMHFPARAFVETQNVHWSGKYIYACIGLVLLTGFIR